MFTIFAHGDESINNGYYNHMMSDNHWSSYGEAPIFWMLLIMLGATIIVGLLFYSKNKTNNANISKSVEVLKLRYANGEITKKQYEDIKKDLA